MTDEIRPCSNCEHPVKHNLWGKCSEEGCDCRSYEPAGDDAKVLVLRNPETFRPVGVPEEVVVEYDRVYKAYVAHREGQSWEMVAATQDWPNARAVATTVSHYLDEGRAIFRGMKGRELMALEIDRLNALQQSFWAGAMAGKIGAGQMVLSCIKARIEAYAKTPEDPDEPKTGSDTPRTLVINSSDYEGDLRGITGSQ